LNPRAITVLSPHGYQRAMMVFDPIDQSRLPNAAPGAVRLAMAGECQAS